MPITDKMMDHAISVLADPEKKAAKARAAHEYLADMTRVIKARLEANSDAKSAAARESDAYAHEDYQRHLEQKRIAAEADYTERERKAAALAIIDVWRTEQSNKRVSESVR